MDEIKIKFKINEQDLIRPALAGVYFLIQDEQVVFIGENKDIKRQIAKHIKQGVQFNTIGISPFSGSNKQRKNLTQSLINKYQPKHNKVSRKKVAQPARTQKKPRSKPGKEVTLPQSRLDMIKPAHTNGSVRLTEAAAKQVEWLTHQGLGTHSDIVQQAIEQLYKEQIARRQQDEDTQPEGITRQEDDPLVGQEKKVISTEAKEALIEWTKKITEEAYEEMTIAEPDSQLDMQGSDLPDWLTNLADETLFGDITIEPGLIEQNSVRNVPQPKLDDRLPDWALGSSQPSSRTPIQAPTHQVEENEETPDWMNDIDMNKPRGKSVSPFG